MKILGEKTLLTRHVQSIVKKLIEIKNGIIFIFTLLCGASERLHFVELPTYTISVSLTIAIPKNNIDTFRVTNKQYFKIILF